MHQVTETYWCWFTFTFNARASWCQSMLHSQLHLIQAVCNMQLDLHCLRQSVVCKETLKLGIPELKTAISQQR